MLTSDNPRIPLAPQSIGPFPKRKKSSPVGGVVAHRAAPAFTEEELSTFGRKRIEEDEDRENMDPQTSSKGIDCIGRSPLFGKHT